MGWDFIPTSPWCAEGKLCKTFAHWEVGMTILWSRSTNPLSTLRQCLTFQYSRMLGVVRLRVFGNPFCIVSINLLFCGSLRPAARIMSGEMNTMLSLVPNVASRVVDLTQLSMSSDSMMSDREGSAGNTSRSV